MITRWQLQFIASLTIATIAAIFSYGRSQAQQASIPVLGATPEVIDAARRATNFRCHSLPVQPGYGARVPGRPGYGLSRDCQPKSSSLQIKPTSADTASAATAGVSNHNGPVVQSAQVFSIFFNCNTSPSSSCWGDPIGFLGNLFVSDFIHITDQYVNSSANGRYTNGTSVSLSLTEPPIMLATDIHQAILAGLFSLFPNGGGGGYNNIYNIFLPNGQNTCFTDANAGTHCYYPDTPDPINYPFNTCAYHASFDTFDAANQPIHVVYTVIPYVNVPGCQLDNAPFPNSQLADSVNNTLSHEIFETITDPDGNAWFVAPQGSEVDGYEIGDLCGFAPMQFNINNKLYDIQLEYDNNSHTCVAASNGMAAIFLRLAPVSNDRQGAVSGDGSVVVGNNASAGPAWRWTAANGIKSLGLLPGADFSLAGGLNADGSVVVGQSGPLGQGPHQAFRWTAATGMTGLGFLTGASFGNGVNADGSVAIGNSGPQAFRWTADTGMVGVGFLPGGSNSSAAGVNADGSVIVGGSNNMGGGSGNDQAVRWTAATGMIGLGFLPGDNFSSATGVNGDGSVVVGYSNDAAFNYLAFRWTNGTMSGLGALPGDLGNVATGVSADGSVVVGYSYLPNGISRAFRWTAADGMQSIADLLTAFGVNLTGWRLDYAISVSADGTIIVGQGLDPSHVLHAWIARLPHGLPSLQVSPRTNIVASGPQGGPFTQPPFSYTLSATSGSVNFSISGVPNWLTPSSTSGTASSGTPVTFTVNANANALAFGTYGPITITFINTINGGGTQTRTATFTVLPRTDTHDYNGEGKSDIAWRDTSGNVAVWLMNGAQVSSSGVFGTVPTSWSIVGQRDFDGDGKADLLWRDTSGNIAMWFLNGVQVSSTAGLGNIPSTWTVVATADFNGDGKGDILWRDTSGNLAMWLMNGATVASSAGVGNVPAAWTIVGTGDYNGDGKADLLWRDTGGNTAIWFMNGATVSSSAGLGNVSTVWSVVGTGDFNGDGKSDILWGDTSGNAAMWFMNGAQVSSTGGLGNVPTTWSIVATGDFNGDGKSDILWRDTSGNTAIWLLNGATVSSSAGLGNTPTNWTVQSANAE